MLKTVLELVYIAVCALVIVLVLMQPGSGTGLGALTGNAGKARASVRHLRTREDRLVIFTRVAVLLFLALTVVLVYLWTR